MAVKTPSELAPRSRGPGGLAARGARGRIRSGWVAQLIGQQPRGLLETGAANIGKQRNRRCRLWHHRRRSRPTSQTRCRRQRSRGGGRPGAGSARCTPRPRLRRPAATAEAVATERCRQRDLLRRRTRNPDRARLWRRASGPVRSWRSPPAPRSRPVPSAARPRRARSPPRQPRATPTRPTASRWRGSAEVAVVARDRDPRAQCPRHSSAVSLVDAEPAQAGAECIRRSVVHRRTRRRTPSPPPRRASSSR